MWEIKELNWEDTDVRYGVYNEHKELVSIHVRKEDAYKMSAFPQMLAALENARDNINPVRSYAEEIENEIMAAIKAANRI